MKELVAEAVADGVRFGLLPDELTSDSIEAGIWPTVVRINRSGWALTRYSCEGHPFSPNGPDGITLYPYVQVACRRVDLLRLVAHMDDVAHEARMAGEFASLHATVASPRWRAVGLCFGRPKHHVGDRFDLISAARIRLEEFAYRLCSE